MLGSLDQGKFKGSCPFGGTPHGTPEVATLVSRASQYQKAMHTLLEASKYAGILAKKHNEKFVIVKLNVKNSPQTHITNGDRPYYGGLKVCDIPNFLKIGAKVIAHIGPETMKL